MNILEEIKNSNKKPKQLLVDLSNQVKKDKKLVKSVIVGLTSGNKVEKGICAEVLEHVSLDKPEFVIDTLDTAVEYLDFDAPRVKWEVARLVGNLAKKYPEKVTVAIPKLMVNAKDKGTVVRWSVAFALSEIAKHNKKEQKKLVAEIKKIEDKEENNGVKNVYLKALKQIEKSN